MKVLLAIFAVTIVTLSSALALPHMSEETQARAEQLIELGYTATPGILNWEMRKDNQVYILPYEGKAINLDAIDKNIVSRVRDYINGGSRLDSLKSFGFWDFIPFETGTLFPDGTKISWPGICYDTVTASMIGNDAGANITFTFGTKKSSECNEFYWLSDRETGHLQVFHTDASQTITIDSWKEYEWSDVQANGIHVYLFPDSWEDTLASIVLTVSLFWDPNPLMVVENKQFFATNMQWHMMERRVNQVNVSAEHIRSGDYLGVMRMDGLDPLIAWGTGGHTGHTAIALWFDDGLYVCESTDTEGLPQLVYWPPPYGVIRTPYEQWITQAMEANYHVVLLPLAEEYSSKFNATAAQNFFYEVEGMPYGWHNFMFTFFDTPMDNLPRPITQDTFEDVIAFLERLIPMDVESSVYNMLIMGYNHRLMSNCTTLQCIWDIIDPIPMTLAELTAIPEQDSWRYQGNYSMVCDVFVCEVWKASGMFGELANEFQCTEQTPKDTYQWAIFEKQELRPAQCIEADYDLPYCQLMGKYQLTLPGYNSISMYPTCNDACPALPPVYSRPPGC